MDDIGFCPRCGKELSAGATYCPACGARLNDPQSDMRETAALDAKNKGRLNIALWILILFAAFSLITGIYILFNAAGVAEMFYDVIEEMAPGTFTLEFLTTLMKWSAVASLFSGALCAAAAVMVLKRRLWVAAVVLCVVTAFLGSIFCLISAWLVYKAKSSFQD
jgi:heme/copper-type cytochrome/quinol oxidase subunit 3